jgi:protein phosphatase
VPFHIEAFGRSDVGQVRVRNEDTLAVEPSMGIVVVADGMGGAPAGDLASALAVQEVARSLHAGEDMLDAVLAANEKIRAMAESQPILSGMGTTVTALQLSPRSGRFVIGHVGDSRAYRMTSGSLSQLTRDHTMVRDMVEAGRIPASAEREHPLAHILSRALGTEEEVDVDLLEGEVAGGDCFLLCSDGLMKVMEDEEIGAWMERLGEEEPEQVVEGMVDEANRRGSPDNVTVALLVVKGAPAASEGNSDP